MSTSQQYSYYINTYYGTPTYYSKKAKKAKPLTVSAFDNGEIIVQKNSQAAPTSPAAFEEYVVSNGAPESVSKNASLFEEYTVQHTGADNGTMAQQSSSVLHYQTQEEIASMFGNDFIAQDYNAMPQNAPMQNAQPSTYQAPAQPYTAPSQESYTQSVAPQKEETPHTLFDATPSNTSTSFEQSNAQNISDFPFASGDNNAAHAQEQSAVANSNNEDDDLIAAMQSILKGEKVFDGESKQLRERKPDEGEKARPPAPSTEELALPKSNEHKIFDKLAESMAYANAYDFGDISLENKFDEFDYIHSVENKPVTAASQPQPTAKPQSVDDTIDSFKALDEILAKEKTNTAEEVARTSTSFTTTPHHAHQMQDARNEPPRPSNLRPYNTAQKQQLFGTFTYEPDPTTFDGDGIRVTNNWLTENITPVAIPQLNGKTFGGRPITSGVINFHKAGATQLQQLWQAWERAGLLSKIISFQGGYAARYIRRTQHRTPRPLSNHAYGTAFDINAEWNGFGAEPALAGTQGSVRELVQIANEHGFFWGGHFGTKDGMHFELAQHV